MTNALQAYLPYIASSEYEQRHRFLAEKMAAGPMSFAEMAETLGLPVAVVVELFNSWRLEAEAKRETKH